MSRKRLSDASVSKVRPPATGQLEIFDTVVPGFGLRVGYGGRKTFFVMVRIGGRLRRLTVGRWPALSLSEARRAARQIMADAAKGIDPKQRQTEEKRKAEQRRRNTFGSVAAEFMEDRARALRTHTEYQRKLNVDILPNWADIPIDQISRADIRALLRQKAHSSPIAANRLQALISTIFNWAIDEEIVAANPAARLRLQMQERSRERVLSANEIAAIWRATETMAYPFGSVYQLLLATAQRRGEVAAMRWSDIRGDAWHLPGQMSKAGHGHAVPLSSLALDILQGVPRFADADLVFISGRGSGKPLSGWSKAKARCNALCNVADWHVHDFRRTAATKMRELGVDRLTVSKVLNHAESGITRVYDRYAEDREKRDALEAWGRRLRMIADGTEPRNVVRLHSKA